MYDTQRYETKMPQREIQRDLAVPVVARLKGILVIMYFQEHNPPHFHVRSGGNLAVIGIDPLEIREGSLSANDRRMVFEWAEVHRAELLDNWDRAMRHEPLKPIDSH